MTGHLDIKDLEKMKKDDLKALAKDMGISDEGTVKELAARIAAEEVEVPEEDELTEEEKEAVKAAEAAEDEEAAEEPPKVSETDTAQEDKKKVTVRVIQTYKDKKAKQVFRPGFEFSISLKRAKELEAAKVAEIVTK